MSWAVEELSALEATGLRRYPVSLSSAQEPEVEIDGRRVVLLCSNNYLGLAADPRVKRAAADAALRWGAGAGASRLVSGTTDLHLTLERELAAHEGCEACVLFSSGYLANLGTIATLVGPRDAVFSDELNHASIIDGCRLSGARRMVYRHADAAHLDELLGATAARRKLVVTDTVFSMDGDLAPLAELVTACELHGAMLMVDEAHATGLLGPGGAGAVAAAGLQGRVDVVMGTLSKSLGSAGGYVAGGAALVELLRNRARAHVFDTAPAPSSVGAALEALRIVRAEPERRERALRLARVLAGELSGMGYQVKRPEAAVVPVMVGGAREAVALSARLLEDGVFVSAIRPPSVPENSSRLRVTSMATHTDEHIERALRAFAAARGVRRSARDSLRRAARGVFVTGTDTGVGKTVTTAVLARSLSLAGAVVAVMKPVQTGTDDGDDDLGFVAAAAGIPPERVARPFVFGEPLAPSVAAARSGACVDVDTIVRAFHDLGSRADVVLVEGAGGLLVPLTPDETMAGLAARLDLPVLIVARPGLGTINHTALTVEAARSRGLAVLGVVLSGVSADPSVAEATNPAEIERLTSVRVIGAIPRLEPCTPQSIASAEGVHSWLAPCLGGDFDREAYVFALKP